MNVFWNNLFWMHVSDASFLDGCFSHEWLLDGFLALDERAKDDVSRLNICWMNVLWMNVFWMNLSWMHVSWMQASGWMFLPSWLCSVGSLVSLHEWLSDTWSVRYMACVSSTCKRRSVDSRERTEREVVFTMYKTLSWNVTTKQKLKYRTPRGTLTTNTNHIFGLESWKSE